MVEVEGVRIGLVHDAGRREGRHERLAAAFPGCDAVAYGHSHIPELARHGEVWILNPGSPTERRRAPAPHAHRDRGRARRAAPAPRHRRLISTGAWALRAQVVDLAAVALDRLRVREQRQHAVAAAEREARVGEVVRRVGLAQRAGAFEPLHGLLEQRQRGAVVACAHAAVARRRSATSPWPRRPRRRARRSWSRRRGRAAVVVGADVVTVTVPPCAVTVLTTGLLRGLPRLVAAAGQQHRGEHAGAGEEHERDHDRQPRDRGSRSRRTGGGDAVGTRVGSASSCERVAQLAHELGARARSGAPARPRARARTRRRARAAGPGAARRSAAPARAWPRTPRRRRSRARTAGARRAAGTRRPRTRSCRPPARRARPRACSGAR